MQELAVVSIVELVLLALLLLAAAVRGGERDEVVIRELGIPRPGVDGDVGGNPRVGEVIGKGVVAAAGRGD